MPKICAARAARPSIDELRLNGGFKAGSEPSAHPSRKFISIEENGHER
jgi:hypothetical protein